jgi:hypothetical protein
MRRRLAASSLQVEAERAGEQIMDMRLLTRIPLAWLLWLLTPLLAIAQGAPGEYDQQPILRSPLFWYWVVLLAVAAAAFAWVSIRLSRRRRPPSRPSTP